VLLFHQIAPASDKNGCLHKQHPDYTNISPAVKPGVFPSGPARQGRLAPDIAGHRPASIIRRFVKANGLQKPKLKNYKAF